MNKSCYYNDIKDQYTVEILDREETEILKVESYPL